MPGGFLHSPLWVPYALYGTIDHVYGFRAWEAHNGFTAAQSALNAVETVAYATYLWWVWRFGRDGEGRVGKRGPGRPRKDGTVGREVVAGKRVVKGRWAGRAVLVGFAASVVTVSKTVLYCESRGLGLSVAVGGPVGEGGGGLGQDRVFSVMKIKLLTQISGLNEYYSGFENIGHNDTLSLVFLWIVPK